MRDVHNWLLVLKGGERKPADRSYRAAEQTSLQSWSLQLDFDFYFNPCFSLDRGANILENGRKCKCNLVFFSPCLDLRRANAYRPPVDSLLGQLLGLFASLRQGLKPDTPSPNGAIGRVVSEVNIYA
jgi:hypothetical protein